MAPAVQEANKEYWRPANLQAERIVKPLTSHSLCVKCDAEYVIGSKFCHVCGSIREARPATPQPASLAQLLDMEVIRKRLSLSVPSLVFFLMGMACMTGALLTGFVYRASTVLDWEAVQSWRIEWLLASIAAMLAGILIKKRDA